ncbi:MAG: cdisaccharide synthetase [Thermovirgaceae bacterium]
MKHILILTNGPGELWCWVRPLVPLLKKAGCRVTVKMLPCQFATGEEHRVASELGADEVVPPGDFLSTLHDLRHGSWDLVLQMGGDLIYGLRAAGRRIPIFCYAYGRKAFMSRTERFLTAWPQMVPEATDYVGDLVADAMKMDEGPTPWSHEKDHRLALFPGSRPSIREASLEYLKEFRAHLDGRGLSIETLTVMSPFATDNEIGRWEQGGLNPVKTGAGVVLKEADLALTQPGTNTLELLYAGVPAIVAVPFPFLRRVPLSGIMGVLDRNFGGEGWLKEKFLRTASRKKGFIAWPNRIAGREIMQEIIGDVVPKDLAGVVSRLLADEKERNLRREELLEFSCDAGAAERVVALVLERLGIG